MSDNDEVAKVENDIENAQEELAVVEETLDDPDLLPATRKELNEWRTELQKTLTALSELIRQISDRQAETLEPKAPAVLGAEDVLPAAKTETVVKRRRLLR
jgi:hypothetical protein